MLAVPLSDTLTGLVTRLRRGQSPFVGDKHHFSHRLVRLGMSKPQAVGTIYLTTATCGLGSLLLHQVNGTGACIILLLVGCMLVLVSEGLCLAEATKECRVKATHIDSTHLNRIVVHTLP